MKDEDSCMKDEANWHKPHVGSSPLETILYNISGAHLANMVQLHESRVFYPWGHWPETVTNVHVSANFH